MLKTTNCSSCEPLIKRNDNKQLNNNELLIFFKRYDTSSIFGNLTPPSDIFFNICKLHLNIISRFIKYNIADFNIQYKIEEMCMLATKQDAQYFDWFSEHKEHKIKFFRFFMVVIIRKSCLWKVGKSEIKETIPQAKAKINPRCERLKILKS